jgi:hypothetical protein
MTGGPQNPNPAQQLPFPNPLPIQRSHAEKRSRGEACLGELEEKTAKEVQNERRTGVPGGEALNEGQALGYLGNGELGGRGGKGREQVYCYVCFLYMYTHTHTHSLTHSLTHTHTYTYIHI